ncbi:MaoC family dehydratase N-terminal domain-containing protein, partial [Planktotalea sp.]|uniref:FAS1-like dehydratase domain-containing protein n=1 Tax=Planktotalea sp. TaxID=2029877 RepID=UPI003296EFAF
ERMADINIEHLKSWEGHSEEHRDLIAAFPSNALSATLDREDAYDIGDPLPPLWHWLHFLPLHKLKDSGYDGHAALGSFLPPVPLPRRMWAGGRLTFKAPLEIGQTLRKTSTVKSVTHKSGRSGDLVFVTVLHEIFKGTTLCLSDEQDIVYRAPAKAQSEAQTPRPAPEQSAFSRTITPDPVLLFRYSALTFNGHRIHYDAPFCKQSEGYTGLIVHGPLLATLMLDLLRREMPQAQVTAFDFRALAPVFDTNAFSVHGTQTETGTARLWIRRHDGALAMEGHARFGSK